MQQDADLIRRVTANYFFWQGLRWVPGGAFMLLLALGEVELPWPRPTGTGGLVLFGVAAAAAYLAYRRIDAYYDRAFGHVHGVAGAFRRRDQVKWLVVYPAMLGSLLLDALVRPPLFVSGAVWGASLVAYWWSTGRGRRHYPLAAAVLAALTVFPPLGILPQGRSLLTLLLALMGVIYVVGGLLDHRELARLLPPPGRDVDATPI